MSERRMNRVKKIPRPKKKESKGESRNETTSDSTGGPPSAGSASAHSHPDHAYAVARLSRIQGQLAGIERMIGEKRYCVDILVQFRAAMAALRNLEAEVFSTHLRHCVNDALRTSDPKAVNQKIEELTELLVRRTRI